LEKASKNLRKKGIFATLFLFGGQEVVLLF
jgi:hypothetical protein